MLCMIWTMFILSTAHWTINLVFTISQIISSASLEEFAHPMHDLLTAVGKANVRDLVFLVGQGGSYPRHIVCSCGCGPGLKGVAAV